MWWKPNNRGYTSQINQAGRYSLEKAERIVDRANIMIHSTPNEAMIPYPEPKEEIKKENLNLVQTCGACPEQYDVFLEDRQVGYLRLRHGQFRADYLNCGDESVYSSSTIGDGVFEADERDIHINNALNAICEKLNHE